IAVAGAAAIGQWSEGAVVAFLFGLSETLEGYTMERARRSIRALMDLAPRIARVRRPDGAVAELPVDEVQVGDLLLVRPGEKIAMDGAILSGSSSINQAAITGESVPVDRGPGAEVFAGTLNGEGALEVQVTRRVTDTTLAKIIHLVEEAQAQRAPSQTFVDRFARVYTPTIMVLAAIIVLLPPLLLGAAWGPWIYRGLALLVVGCPCALVVSTPVTLLSAIANGARHGVLVKGGAYLEQAAAIRAIAFDKTGTLTAGRPVVTDLQPLDGRTPEELVALAAAVEAESEHPLARAIRQRAEGMPAFCTATQFQATTGRGARALVDGEWIYAGSLAFFQEHLGLASVQVAELAAGFAAAGKSVVLIGSESALFGLIAVADTPRADSRATLAALKQAGIRHTVMLTGDNLATATAIGGIVGVDEVQAELMPEGKVAAIRALVAQYGAVAMVGDGVNDAPALAAANLGIAVAAGGTDVALETADIALMGDGLARLPFMVRLSRAALTTIQQNIGIALAFKLLAVAAVFPGWLTLWLAILADMGASVLVTLNGMRLLRLKPE
ncbi:MAG: heavy metal translocating P-type ATPase, partial [Mycobacterium leprae]